jgi:Transglycosylase SLT domain
MAKICLFQNDFQVNGVAYPKDTHYTGEAQDAFELFKAIRTARGAEDEGDCVGDPPGHERTAKSPAWTPKAAKSPSRDDGKFSLLIEQAAADTGVDAALIRAVMKAESGYNPDATSAAGAVGLMQLMPETAERYGVNADDRSDPAESIKAGARYLRDLLKMFKQNIVLAVAGYNAGENAVKRHKNTVPPYPETQSYVAEVLANYGIPYAVPGRSSKKHDPAHNQRTRDDDATPHSRRRAKLPKLPKL